MTTSIVGYLLFCAEVADVGFIVWFTVRAKNTDHVSLVLRKCDHCDHRSGNVQKCCYLCLCLV